MNKNEAAAALKSLCEEIGFRRDFVQGGGGNISVKADGGIMLIKASGYLLREVTQTEGFCDVDYKKLRSYYKNGGRLEDPAKKEKRPSIEVGFHAILGDYVIHTHSVYANVLTCSKEGKQLVQRIFGDAAVWCGYAMPGHNTARTILQALQEKKIDPQTKSPVVLFLENHGLVVSAQSAEDALKAHTEVNRKLMELFGEAGFIHAKLTETTDGTLVENNPIPQKYIRSALKGKVLFPDQTVYASERPADFEDRGGTIVLNKKKDAAQAMYDTLGAYTYIAEAAEENGYRLRYLSDGEVAQLLENEQEAYRKRMMQEGAL